MNSQETAERIAIVSAHLSDAYDWALLLKDDGLIKGHVIQHLEIAKELIEAAKKKSDSAEAV